VNPNDPTHGYKKEFFIMPVGNPMLPPDEMNNPFMPTPEQFGFIACYYPLYIQAPQSMIAWLYSCAATTEE
jgi:hypothetical protein